MHPFNAPNALAFVTAFWERDILPTLTEYVTIPNQSPDFDPAWRANGHMHRAVDLVRQWMIAQVPEATVTVADDGVGTPVLFLELAGTAPGDVLLYGHLDKQPPLNGWDEGLGPWTPVRRGDKLYGRGSADDGYAAFAIVAAIKALQSQGAAHPRIVALLECEEESGSPGIGATIERHKEKIGDPGLIICLDSGCASYDTLWRTTTLRGLLAATLTVEVLREGVHSGDGGGIVPPSLRILRLLLDRIEDARTGDILPPWLHVELSAQQLEDAKLAAAIIGDGFVTKMPFLPGVHPMAEEPLELLLNNTWRPTLAITGQEGIPSVEHGGNVLHAKTTFKLSVRIPPTLALDGVGEKLKALLEADPPYGATVRCDILESAGGFATPALTAELAAKIDAASQAYFGAPSRAFGEGGSIPFMGLLAEKYPRAQFLITGVLGPQSNAHGPNEFLHIPAATKLSAAIAHVLAAEAR